MILERRQVAFFALKTLKIRKKNRKNDPISIFFLQIRIPDGLIVHFQLVNIINSTSRKLRKQQRLVLLNISGFDRNIFGLRFWILPVFYVNRTR